jgi:hypothetical protein
VKTGLFSTIYASIVAAILPLFWLRLIKPEETISGGFEAEQTVQETKRHQASGEIVRSEDPVADVASMTR